MRSQRAKAQELFNMGKNYFNTNNFPEARTVLLQAYDKNPKIPNLLVLLGQTNVALQRFKEAVEFFSEALDAKPSRVNYFNLANAFYEYCDYLSAKKKAEEGLHVFFKDPNLLHLMGQITQQLGSPGEARYYYKLAVSYKKSFAVAWHNLGILEFVESSWVEASICFEKAVNLDPQNLLYLEFWAKSLELTGNQKQHAQALGRLLTIYPDSKLLVAANTIPDRKKENWEDATTYRC